MKQMIIPCFIAACLAGTACSASKAGNQDEDRGETIYITSSARGIKVITASNNYVSKSIAVKDFSGINSQGSFKVEYRQSNRPRVEFYLPDNILPYVKAEVTNGILYLRSKENMRIRFGNNRKDKIIVYAPSVRKFTLNGSGDLATGEPLSDARGYTFQLNGSGDINIRNVNTKGNVLANLAGSGDIHILNVSAASVSANLAGSGDLDIFHLKSRTLTANLAGSGDMNIADAKAESTAAALAGSGDMRMKGSTSVATYTVTGSGDIHAGGLKSEKVNATATGSGEITCYATGATNFQTIHKGTIRNVAD